MSKNKFTTIFIALLLVFIATMPVKAARAELAVQTGYKLPFPAGKSYAVRQVGKNHGAGRNAIDFGLSYNLVSAMAAGHVRTKSSTTSGGKYVTVDHGGYCSHYYHLSDYSYVRVGEYVEQGQIIAKSGNTGTSSTGPHLHVSLMIDVNNNCPWNKLQEYPIGFVEYGNAPILSKALSSKVSQNTIPIPTNPTFTTSARSTLAITTAEVNLKVCDTNLAGKTVYATLYRGPANGYAAKTWTYQKVATSGCVTFLNMDGTGNTFAGVTYYSTASKSPISSADSSAKRTSCFSATGGRQLCDAVRR
jgi:hypothetical protein